MYTYLKYLTITICLTLLIKPILFAQYDHTHIDLNQLLTKYVVIKGSKSLVNYKGIKQEYTKLDKYIRNVEDVTLLEFEKFSKQEQIAFLINAYNALTIKLILDNYPVNSIKDIGSFFKSTWKINFFNLFHKKQNLDYIEHELLRKNYNEPRIHFALVCASKSCPPLSNKAYTGEKLEQQLENATKKFLNDLDRNYYVNSTLYLSKIFKWFEDDFLKKDNSVTEFVLPRIKALKNDKTKLNLKIKYLPYDWSLNDASK